jgi:hypothetical protein
VEPELVALATAGATTLVQQMATDGWSQARSRITRFFARGEGTTDEETVGNELEATRGEVTAALADDDADLVADLEVPWRLRIRHILATNAAAADQLREILAELELPEKDGGVLIGSVHNKSSSTVNGGVFIQSGYIGSVKSTESGPGRN